MDPKSFKAPWWARWLRHLREAVDDKGGDVDASKNMHEWVSANPAFENVVYREHYLGVVPHPRNGPDAEELKRIDGVMAENVLVSSVDNCKKNISLMDKHSRSFEQVDHSCLDMAFQKSTCSTWSGTWRKKLSTKNTINILGCSVFMRGGVLIHSWCIRFSLDRLSLLYVASCMTYMFQFCPT